MTSLSVNFSTNILLPFSGSLCLAAVFPDSDIKLWEVVVPPSIVSSCSQSVKKTNSVDSIPAFVYERCTSLHTPLVSFLLYNIINTCVLSAAGKWAFVTPILKSESPNDITNYRPISVLHHIIVYVLREFSLIIYIQSFENICQKFQPGFRKQRSTATHYLLYLDEVYHTRDFNVPSAAVGFDFSKAFDFGRHDIILKKLSVYAFDHDFLFVFRRISVTDHSVFVQTSSFHVLLQVTFLKAASWGRSFFLLSINDMPECIEFSSCYLFAAIQSCFLLILLLYSMILIFYKLVYSK